MNKIFSFACCLVVASLTACGSQSGKPAEDATAADSTEQVAEEQAPELTDTPLELADYAVECFRTNQREKLFDYATERCKQQMARDIAIEKQMANDRGIREMRERLMNTTYTRSSESDMGNANKLVRYKSNPSKYNMKVLLEMHDGKWLVDQVGPDMGR